MKNSRHILFAMLLAATVAITLGAPRASRAEAPQYELVPRGTPVRWNFWLSDGPALVYSANSSVGNRFQIGAESHFGQDYRWVLGLTLIDWQASSESAPGVGSISRYGFDLRAAYFVVPDRLFLEYALYLGEVEGSQIWGWSSAIGQQVGLGWRVYDQNKFNITIVANYQYISSESVSGVDRFTGNIDNVTFPHANVYSLNFRFGYDLGGKP